MSSLWFIKGLKTNLSVLKPTSTISPIVTKKAKKKGRPSSIKPTKDNTAKKTIAPCAKLKVAEALYIRTKPNATNEYIVPANKPATTTSKKNNISLPMRNS